MRAVGVSLVELVDNEDDIRLAGPRERLHDFSGFCVDVDARAAGQGLGVADGAHVEDGGRELQDAPDRVGEP